MRIRSVRVGRRRRLWSRVRVTKRRMQVRRPSLESQGERTKMDQRTGHLRGTNLLHWTSYLANLLSNHLSFQPSIHLTIMLCYQSMSRFGQAKSGAPGLVGLRATFWNHIHEAQKRLQEAHPEASKKEVLKMAREESWPQK